MKFIPIPQSRGPDTGFPKHRGPQSADFARWGGNMRQCCAFWGRGAPDAGVAEQTSPGNGLACLKRQTPSVPSQVFNLLIQN